MGAWLQDNMGNVGQICNLRGICNPPLFELRMLPKRRRLQIGEQDTILPHKAAALQLRDRHKWPQSCRKVVIGSSRPARHAGISAAVSATTKSMPVAAAALTGSR